MRWDLDVEPIFDNTMGLIVFDGERADLKMERARLDEQGVEWLEIFKEMEL